jgi:hypothetical protein
MEILGVDIKIILQVLLTLAIFSFLFKDNPIYRFAEHLFVGIAAGYIISIQFNQVFLPNLWRPFTRALAQGVRYPFTGRAPEIWDVLLIVPFVLGFLMFTKFHERSSWLARWPMAAVVGTFSGLAIIGFAQGDLIPQIQANLLPIVKPGSWEAFARDPGLFTALQVLWNPILIVGVFCCLVYFFFSKEHKGVTGGTAKVGIWFLMISFGASYGNTVSTRISLFLERCSFLFEHPGVTAVGLVLIVAALAMYFARSKESPEGQGPAIGR